MAKQIEKTNETEQKVAFNVVAFLANVANLASGELRDLIESKINADETFNAPETDKASQVMFHVDATLTALGLVMITLPNAKMRATAVIAKPSETTVNKERWFTYANLFSAKEGANDTTTIVCKPSYLIGKVAGFEAAPKAVKAAPALASLSK